MRRVVQMRIHKRSVKTSLISSIFTFPALFTILFLFTSCPSPISNSIVSQKRDEGAPSITITSPADGDFYTELVTITGKVGDDSASGGEIGEIRSLSYEVIGPLGTFELSELSFNTDGLFTFQFATANIDGSAVVKITAMDWNENVGEYSITLKDPGNDIPSFTVKADNQEVKLSWDPVPNATGYTVHYTTNGTPPSINYGKKIQNISQAYSASNPLVIDELKNGNMHVFLVQAHSSNPSDLWLSNNENAIPLSPLTLAPQVTGEFAQIRIEWNSIPATDQFEVMRATQSDGDYINISGIIETTSLTDDTVDDGQVYFYKVKPSFAGSIESDPNCDETSPFTFAQEIELLSTFPATFAPPGAVAVKDNFAYMVDYSGWVYKINISNPSNPFFLTQYKLPASLPFGAPFGDIAVDDSYVYVALKLGGGFYILDKDTLNPVLQLQGFSVYGIDLDLTYAYVVFYGGGPSGPPGLYRFEIANPFNYAPYAGPLISLPTDVAVNSSWIYVTDFSANLYVVDVGSFTYSRTIPMFPYINPTYRMSASDDYVSIGGYYYSPGLAVVKVSDDTVKQYPGYILSTAVKTIGSYAYVADRNTGLSLINVFSDPPILNSLYDTPGNIESVDVSGQYAYVTDDFEGLMIFDVSTSVPDNPVVLQTYGSDDAKNVAVSGNRLYIADGESGLQVIDVTSPGSPTYVGSWDTLDAVPAPDDAALDVFVSGDYVFIAFSDAPNTNEDDEGALHIIDTADLSGSVGSLVTPGDPEAAVVSGDYVYVADGVAGLQIIDISSPDDPKRVGSRNTPGGDAKGVAVKGNYAFVADGGGGIHSIIVSVPNNPIIVDTYDPGPQDYTDVEISGNYAYVTDGNNGLDVIDISFPNTLKFVGSVNTPGGAESVAISGNYAFVADMAGGMQVVDITIPSSPVIIGAVDTSGNAVGVSVAGSYAYVANDSADVKIIDLLPNN
jgi:hypothetical protein